VILHAFAVLLEPLMQLLTRLWLESLRRNTRKKEEEIEEASKNNVKKSKNKK